MHSKYIKTVVLCLALFSHFSCQYVLGFEDFEAGDGAVPEDQPDGEAKVKGIKGAACTRSDQCDSGLECVYGRCRKACSDQNDCESTSICLFDGDIGGCRLEIEAECDGDCDNNRLICGLDSSCRVKCSEQNSCDSSTQLCIASGCVSTTGYDSEIFDCGESKEADVVCVDSALSVCNVLGPGLVVIENCSSASVCKGSRPPDGKYPLEAEPEPSCNARCLPNERYCDGPTLLTCKQDGSGPIDQGQDCLTEALCLKTIADQQTACSEPKCDVGETRCTGGQTELRAEVCDEGRTGFAVREYCDADASQCNPATGRCIQLAIDETEVTTADYDAWLATNPDVSEQDKGCLWNVSFDPDSDCLTDTDCSEPNETCPVVCIDWCDANAYCQAMGKRLCGRIGGGMVPFDDYADPGKSEWMNACTAAGQFFYGHGDDSPETEPPGCSYEGIYGSATYGVSSHEDCRSPGYGYDHIYDMSGNVAEWEDACESVAIDDAAGPDDACRTRGGSYDSPLDLIECDAVSTIPMRRDGFSRQVGFRCCG